MEKQISWLEWYPLVFNELRDAIANEEIHPQGRAFCHEWLNELIDAAERNDHAECLRLEALIRERIARELSLCGPHDLNVDPTIESAEHAAQPMRFRNEAAR